MVKSFFSKIVLCLMAMALHNSILAERAVVIGKITNTKVKSCSISYNEGLIAYKNHKQTFTIDAKGNFKLLLDLSEMKQVFLFIDAERTSFYVQPKDSFLVSINYTDFDNSLLFSGNSGAKNNFFKAFTVKFISGHERDRYRQAALRKANNYAAYCDSLLNEQLNFLSTYTAAPGLDSYFLKQFKNDLIYENACKKLQYPGFWSYYNRKGDTLPEMPYSYFDFIKNLPLDNDTLVANEKYMEYIKSAMYRYKDYIKTSSGIVVTDEQSLELARVLLKNDKVRLAYAASIIYRALEREELGLTEKMYFDYAKKNKGSIYLPELEALYTRMKKISPGQPAPGFSLKTPDGKDCNLDDFKGKIIFLDFWASWCGPCIREMPSSKKIEEAYRK